MQHATQRLPFDPSQPAIARKEFTASGVKYQRGDSFPTAGRHPRSLESLYTAGYIDFGELRDNHEKRMRLHEEREAQAARVAMAEQAADRARTGMLADLEPDQEPAEEPEQPRGRRRRRD